MAALVECCVNYILSLHSQYSLRIVFRLQKKGPSESLLRNIFEASLVEKKYIS